jgi:hypothetical protein
LCNGFLDTEKIIPRFTITAIQNLHSNCSLGLTLIPSDPAATISIEQYWRGNETYLVRSRASHTVELVPQPIFASNW